MKWILLRKIQLITIISSKDTKDKQTIYNRKNKETNIEALPQKTVNLDDF